MGVVWKIGCVCLWLCSTRFVGCGLRVSHWGFGSRQPMVLKGAGMWPRRLSLPRRLKRGGVIGLMFQVVVLVAHQSITPGPGYQVQFASEIRAASGLATMAVGMITEAQQAEQILSGGHADMIAMARGMLWDPHWAWHAAHVLGDAG